MNRLIENTVFSGLTAACRRASWPTRRSPDLVKATTEGVVRPPSAFGMTTGSPASMTATTEFVVPRSMPTVFAIVISPSFPRPGHAGRRGKLGGIYPRHLGAKRIRDADYVPAARVELVQERNAHGDRGLRPGWFQPGAAAE